MRKLFCFISTTVDGYYEGPNQEFDHWTVDDAFLEFSVSQLRDVGVLLFGRVTYEGMAAYCPTDEARRDTGEIADLMNDLPKIVFSTTLTEPLAWRNTRLVGADLAGAISALKREPGRDLAVLGSPRLTVGLLDQGLVDERRVMVNPTLLGAGPSLFHGLTRRVGLELLQASAFRSGNVLLTYRPSRA